MTQAQIKGLQQFGENLVVAALVAGLTAVAPYVEGTGAIDWPTVLHVFLIAVIFAVLNAISIGIKAINPALGAVAQSDVQATQAHYPLVSVTHYNNAPSLTTTTTTGTGTFTDVAPAPTTLDVASLGTLPQVPVVGASSSKK